VLLAPARSAGLPPAAREAGQHWLRRRAKSSRTTAVAGSADAEARWAASGRSGGFALIRGAQKRPDQIEIAQSKNVF
jgi:hypothetical protein